MKRLIYGFVAVFLIVMLVASLQIWSYAGKRVTVHADAAVVLGAAVWESRPSPVFEKRIEQGINLYREGYVKKIIFTGGSRSPNEITEAEAARNYALAEGVNPEDILLEKTSLITEQNLINAFKAGKRHGIHSYIIVSDPLHMKRSMMIAGDIGMESYPGHARDTAYRSWQTKLPFVMREAFYYIGYQMLRPFR